MVIETYCSRRQDSGKSRLLELRPSTIEAVYDRSATGRLYAPQVWRGIRQCYATHSEAAKLLKGCSMLRIQRNAG